MKYNNFFISFYRRLVQPRNNMHSACKTKQNKTMKVSLVAIDLGLQCYAMKMTAVHIRDLGYDS